MFLRLFIALVILIAIAAGAVAVLGVILPHNQLMVHLIIFRDFFDVCLPILGFGALVKYLCSCGCTCGCGCCKS